MSLSTQLERANNIFIKAKKRYEGVIEDCLIQHSEAKALINYYKEKSTEALLIMDKARESIDKIDEIIR